MKKILVFTLFIMMGFNSSYAQKYFTHAIKIQIQKLILKIFRRICN